MNRSTLSDIMLEAIHFLNLDLPWEVSCDDSSAYFRTYIDGHGHVEDGRYITLYDTDNDEVLIDVSDEDTLDILLESITRSAYPLGVGRYRDNGYVTMSYEGTCTDIVRNYDTMKKALLNTLCCFLSLCGCND